MARPPALLGKIALSNRNRQFSHRRSIRLPGYDYRQAGVYFVTICTYQKSSMLGAIRDGEVILSDLGAIARDEWLHMAKARPNVHIGDFVVMPNHIHGVIVIDEAQSADSSRCGPGTSRKGSRTLKAGSLGAIVGQFKLAVARRAKSRHLHPHKKIWQRNYYDHIVRNEESLNEIRRYIIENPAHWSDDSLYVD